MIWRVRVARIITVCVALLIAAWFVLGARQARELDHATTVIESASSLTAAQAARVDSMLSAAATLNPDQEVSLLRARVAVLQGHNSAATHILERLVQDEPLNIEGWVWLARVALPSRTLFDRALVNIHRLDRIGSRGL